MVEWLQVAAPVEGFIGFAVGRSTFLESIVGLQAKKISRTQASDTIVRKFVEWVDVFEKARGKR